MAIVALITAGDSGWISGGVLVVIMLSGGQALEFYAMRKASSVLRALSGTHGFIAHHQKPAGRKILPLAEIAIGDEIIIHPHETTPVDGIVIEGRWLYGWTLPWRARALSCHRKPQWSPVLSGAINGDMILRIRAEKLAIDFVMPRSWRDARRRTKTSDHSPSGWPDQGDLCTTGSYCCIRDLVFLQEILFTLSGYGVGGCNTLPAVDCNWLPWLVLYLWRQSAGSLLKTQQFWNGLPTCRTAILIRRGTPHHGKARSHGCYSCEGSGWWWYFALGCQSWTVFQTSSGRCNFSAADKKIWHCWWPVRCLKNWSRV